MKTCTKCKIEKPLDLFQKSTRVKSGYEARCRECNSNSDLKTDRIKPYKPRSRIVVGLKLWRLTFVEKVNGQMWKVECECGNSKVVDSGAVRSGHTKSCGCIKKASKGSCRKYEGLPTGFAHALAAYRYRAKKASLEFTLTVDEFHDLIMGSCVYCGNPPESGTIHYSFRSNGIDRIDSSKGYVIDNCESCCAVCNRAKLEMDKSDFISWIGRVVKFNLSKVR